MESNGSTTEWDEGMYVQGYVGKGGKALESFCEAISPTAHAQTTWQGRPCGQTWQIVQGVLWRAGGWSGGAFFSAVAPCMFSTPGFYGPCVVGAASGGYIWGLIYEGYDAGMTCRQGRPWSV